MMGEARSLRRKFTSRDVRVQSFGRIERLSLILLLTTAAILAAATSMAGDDETWLTRKNGTGDWEGLRQKWLENGVIPGGFYVIDILGNPTGGIDQRAAYAGRAEFDLSLNLARLAGAKGLAFDLAFSWSSGSNLSDDIGNVFQVGQAYSGRTVQLTRLFFEQTLADGKLFLKLGRISAGNDFAILPSNIYYVNAAINGNPLSIPLNEPGFFTDPVAQWGLRVLYHPIEQLRLRFAAYNPDPEVGEEGKHGFDFSFNPADGVLFMAEVGYSPKIKAGGKTYRGLYKAGAYLDTSDFASINDSTVHQSSQYGLYFMAQQEVTHEERDPSEIEFRPLLGRHLIRTEAPINVVATQQGLTPWIAIALSPRQEISPMPVYVAGGLLYRGLFRGRPNDRTGLGIFHGRFSDHMDERGSETVIELNHVFQATPYVYLTPDLQYVIDPGGTDIPNALVLGFEVGFTF